MCRTIRPVAAVYDRRHFVNSRKKPALIERRYSRSIRVIPRLAKVDIMQQPTHQETTQVAGNDEVADAPCENSFLALLNAIESAFAPEVI